MDGRDRWNRFGPKTTGWTQLGKYFTLPNTTKKAGRQTLCFFCASTLIQNHSSFSHSCINMVIVCLFVCLFVCSFVRSLIFCFSLCAGQSMSGSPHPLAHYESAHVSSSSSATASASASVVSSVMGGLTDAMAKAAAVAAATLSPAVPTATAMQPARDAGSYREIDLLCSSSFASVITLLQSATTEVLSPPSCYPRTSHLAPNN
jgi:hypothetical protein